MKKKFNLKKVYDNNVKKDDEILEEYNLKIKGVFCQRSHEI